MRGRLTAFVVLGCLLVGAACSSDSSSSPDTTEPTSFQQGGEMRLAAVDVRSLDPAAAIPTNQSEMITIDLLYDSLTVFPTELEDEGDAIASSGTQSDDVTATPDVAASLTPNADSTVWTVKLADRTFS